MDALALLAEQAEDLDRLVEARRILIATGVTDEVPEIPGVRERWGRDLLHCPYCHGYEVRAHRTRIERVPYRQSPNIAPGIPYRRLGDARADGSLAAALFSLVPGVAHTREHALLTRAQSTSGSVPR